MKKVRKVKKGFILLAHTKINMPSRYTSSFPFSLLKVSTYSPSLLKNFRNDFQTPPTGFHLLRGFSSQKFIILTNYFQTWSVYRT